MVAAGRAAGLRVDKVAVAQGLLLLAECAVPHRGLSWTISAAYSEQLGFHQNLVPRSEKGRERARGWAA